MTRQWAATILSKTNYMFISVTALADAELEHVSPTWERDEEVAPDPGDEADMPTLAGSEDEQENLVAEVCLPISKADHDSSPEAHFACATC